MKIIFLYNAESGFVNTLIDIGHKIISSETYSCNLCKLTFGNFKESSRWKEFRENSRHEMEFLHKDEFEEKYGQKFEYPLVLTETQDTLKEVNSRGTLEGFRDIDELIEAVSKI